MNREKVSAMQHKKVRIRPIARRIELDGRELPPVEQVTWSISERTTFKEYVTDYSEGSDGILIFEERDNP